MARHIAPRTPAAHAGRRGFAIMELFISLMLLTAVALLGTQVFMGSVHLIDGTGVAQSNRSHFDAVTHVLRADVWGSDSIAATDPMNLKLGQPDGHEIGWTVHADGSLERSEASAPPDLRKREWRSPGVNLRFVAAGGGIDLVATPNGSEAGGRTRMVSAPRLMAAGPAREKTP